MNPLQREAELIGQSLDDVPKVEPGENCNGRKSRDGSFQGYCQATAGRGTDHTGTGRCKHHGGAGGGPSGKANGNYKHGAFSKHLQSDLSERETEAFEDLATALGDQEAAQDVVRELAAEALLKYKRSNDARFLREARQLLSEFNIADATDHVDVDGVEGMLMKDLREAHDE